MGLRIAACQMNSQGDKDANLATAERLIDEAARQGAQMVGLPELFNLLADDATMVAHKSQAQKIKELVAKLAASKEYKHLV